MTNKKLSKEQLADLGLLPKEYVVNEMNGPVEEEPVEDLGVVENAFHGAEEVVDVEMPQPAAEQTPSTLPAQEVGLSEEEAKHISKKHSDKAGIALEILKARLHARELPSSEKLVNEAFEIAEYGHQPTSDEIISLFPMFMPNKER